MFPFLLLVSVKVVILLCDLKYTKNEDKIQQVEFFKSNREQIE